MIKALYFHVDPSYLFTDNHRRYHLQNIHQIMPNWEYSEDTESVFNNSRGGFFSYFPVCCMQLRPLQQSIYEHFPENKAITSLILHVYWVFRLVTNDHKLLSISSANYVSLRAIGASQSGPARTHRRRCPPSCVIVTAMIVTVSPQWINGQPC